jgi:TolB-like protein/cytochrome c-type biogenesis protein CcmH/NrfG
LPGPDIFLSYNREDQAVAKIFAETFEAAGLSVWWDATLRSGEAYDQVTEEALRGAKAVVVLWSPRSVASRWVRAEASIADENGTLAPANIEACDLPVMFRLTQTADLTHWRGEAGDPAWQGFLGDVRRMAGNDAASAAARPKPAFASTDGGIPTVAVVPLACRGGGEDLEFFAEDLTEDITRELAQNSLLEVVAAGRMAAWRDKPADYEAIRSQLGARYLVEGKLQRSGETVRLVAQIIDTEASKTIGSKRFVRKADGVEAEEFVAAIVAELGEDIHQIEMQRAMAKLGPWSGWEHYLRSWAYARHTTSGSMSRHHEEARQAVAKAPSLGVAHAQLVSALTDSILVGGEQPDEALRNEIRTHAVLAMQLDGNNPTVVSSVVGGYAVLGDFDAALRLARRAVELNPNNPYSYVWLGFAHMLAGDTARAISAYEQQDRLTSNDTSRYQALGNLGRCLAIEGRLDKAEEALDRSLALHPDYANTLKWKAIVAALQGDNGTALATVRRLREAEPSISIDKHVRQILFYTRLADRLAEPVAILRRLWEEAEGEAAHR